MFHFSIGEVLGSSCQYLNGVREHINYSFQ